MSNTLNNLNTLHSNPFIFSSILFHFFESLEAKPNGLLLSYLVLPTVLYPFSQAFLLKATSRSNLRTFVKEKSRIYGLQERLQEKKEITNVTVQYLLDLKLICLGKDLSVKKIKDFPKDYISVKSQIKASSRLAEIFLPFEIPLIYQKLGVKSL